MHLKSQFLRLKSDLSVFVQKVKTKPNFYKTCDLLGVGGKEARRGGGLSLDF